MIIEYKLADGSTAWVDVTEELAEFLEEDDRRTSNADRRERYHAPFSIDALLYEGEEYADKDTPETIYLACEEEDEEDRMERYLSVLTETQRRRVRMRLAGLTYREIAEIERTDFSSVAESLKAAGKKLHKTFPKIF